jgi:hypothetical protein
LGGGTRLVGVSRNAQARCPHDLGPSPVSLRPRRSPRSAVAPRTRGRGPCRVDELDGPCDPGWTTDSCRGWRHPLVGFAADEAQAGIGGQRVDHPTPQRRHVCDRCPPRSRPREAGDVLARQETRHEVDHRRPTPEEAGRPSPSAHDLQERCIATSLLRRSLSPTDPAVVPGERAERGRRRLITGSHTLSRERESTEKPKDHLAPRRNLHPPRRQGQRLLLHDDSPSPRRTASRVRRGYGVSPRSDCSTKAQKLG